MKVISIGNFDGVHLGHQRLLQQLSNFAKNHNSESVVITFDPHPKVVLTGQGPRMIYDLETRIRALKSLGVDRVEVVEFTTELAQMSGEEFLDQYIGFDNLAAMVQGSNFRFGHRAACDSECIEKLATKHNFDFISVELESAQDQVISATVIRQLLKDNQIAAAYELFGDNYFYNYLDVRCLNNEIIIKGVVGEGKKFGRQIETPTANLINLDVRRPNIQDGIYAGTTTYNGVIYPSAMSVLGGQIETHLIGFSGDLYGHELSVRFTHRLRDSIHYENTEDLIIQIKRDLLMSYQLYRK